MREYNSPFDEFYSDNGMIYDQTMFLYSPWQNDITECKNHKLKIIIMLCW